MNVRMNKKTLKVNSIFLILILALQSLIFCEREMPVSWNVIIENTFSDVALMC